LLAVAAPKPGELAGERGDDVAGLVGAFVPVLRGAAQRKGGWTFTRSKGRRGRAVPAPAELVPALRKPRADQDTERAACHQAWQDYLVWCGPTGRSIDPHDDWEEWKALLTEAGITKDARLRDARHTAGTLLGEHHVDMHVIQRILGHAQVTTTRLYTRERTPPTR
jgi:site-specific recombinase XerD